MNSELKISIYSHDDDFIDLLYTSEREFDGQCFNPILTVNANGAKTFAFSMPLKVLNAEKTEYIDNVRWQYVTNQYKIRVEREGEKTEEFVLRDYTESHNESDQMMIDVNCMSLAEFELGQTGYNLTFNEQTLYVYPENVDPNDPDAKPVGVETSDIHFWANKIVENTDWDYRVESYYDVDAEIEDNRQIVADDNIYTGPNQFYENDRIIDYTDTNEPIKKDSYDIKERILKAEKSNRWNLSQDLCESFEIWADYEIKYENGKVVSKTIVFKNDVPEDALFSVRYGKNQKNVSRQVDDSQIVTKMYVTPLTNPNTDSGVVAIANNAKNYMKENYILDLSWYLGDERKDVDVKNKQLLPSDLSYTFPAADKITYPALEHAISVDNTKDLIQEYQHQLRCRNTFIERATQRLSEAKEELSELKAQYEFYAADKEAAQEQVSTITDEIALLPKGVQRKENKVVYVYLENGEYIIRFSETGIKYLPNSATFARPVNLTDSNDNPYMEASIVNLGLAIHKVEPITRAILEARLIDGKIGDAQEYASFQLDLEYYPLDFEKKLKEHWLAKVNEAVIQLNLLGKGRDLGDTSGLIYEKEVEVDALKGLILVAQLDKKELTNTIEGMLAPFIREGYWEDSSYTTYMNQADAYTKQFPAESIIKTVAESQQWTKDYWSYKIPNNLIGTVDGKNVYLYDVIDINSLEVMNKSIVTAEYDENFKMYIKGATNAMNGVDYTVEYGYTNTDKQSLDNRGIYINFYDPEDGTIFTQTTDTRMYVRAKARGTDFYIFEDSIPNQHFVNSEGATERMYYASMEQILTIDHEDVILSSIEVLVDGVGLQHINGANASFIPAKYNLIYGTDYYTYKETIDNKVYTKIRLNPTTNVPLMTFGGSAYCSYEIQCNYDVTSKYYYNDALDTMKESSVPQVTYNISIANLCETEHPELNYRNFKPIAGTRVPIYDSELGFDGLLGFINTVSFNLLEPQNTEITISNFKDKFEDLFQKITAATIQLQNKGDYYDYATTITDNTGVINKDLLADTLMQNNLELSLSTNNDVVWNEKGIEITNKVLNENGVYGKIKITSNGIFIADRYDEYGNYKWQTAITPSYINASAMVVGKLDTRQIQIWNSTQTRFLWNANGIYAYGQDSKGNTDFNSYVLYNQDGLQFKQLIERTKTTVFRNKIQNPNFEGDYIQWSTDENATLDISVAEGYNVLISTTQVARQQLAIYHHALDLNKKHKYYFRATVGAANVSTELEHSLVVGLQNFAKTTTYSASEDMVTISGFVTGATIQNLYYVQFNNSEVANNWQFKLTQPLLIDIDETFGEGVTVTLEELDKLPFFVNQYAYADTFNIYKDAVKLDWNGLALDAQDGALKLTSQNGLEVLQPDENSLNESERRLKIQLGKWTEDDKEKYGLRGFDAEKRNIFELSDAGLFLRYGDSNQTIDDIIDSSLSYSVDIISTNGLIFKNGNVNTQLKAIIYKGQIDITNTLPNSAISWQRESGNEQADATWNENHKGYGSILELTNGQIDSQATFTCVVDI